MSKRSFKVSIVLSIVVTVLLFMGQQPAWGRGFMIGAFCSLFSMFTLTVVIPALFRPGASIQAHGLLSLTLIMKLPIYCAALYLVTLPSVSPIAAGIGAGLVPAVITLKAILSAMRHATLDKRDEEAVIVSLNSPEYNRVHEASPALGTSKD